MPLRVFRRAAAGLAVAAAALAGVAPAWAQVNTTPLSVLQLSSQSANTAALQANAQRASALQDALDRTNAGERARSREGSSVEAEGGPALQTAAGRDVRREANGEPEPFGASLFENTGPLPPSDAVNPDYQIQPGDKIGLNVLGASSGPVTADLSTTSGSGPQPPTAASRRRPRSSRWSRRSTRRATSSCPTSGRSTWAACAPRRCSR